MQIFFMAINKEKKKEIIESLSKDISSQKGIFFVNFRGMKGEGSRELREKLSEKNAKIVVARKTLAKIAFEKEGVDFDPLSLDKEVGFVFDFEDGIGAAKILSQFEKKETISFLGGLCEGSILSAKEAQLIAELPTREELLGKLVGTMNAPIIGFLQVLQGNTKGLLQVLKQAKV